MAFVSAVEIWIPFRARGTRSARPNLALTALFFALNLAVTAPFVIAAEWMSPRQLGLLHLSGLSPVFPVVAGVVLLDFSAYVVHVLMHKVQWMWRFHRVHHSDTLVDVTTAYRQHPGETLFRFAFTAVPALLLGAPPAAIALYRTLSGVSAVIEHANVKLPEWLDRALRTVIVGPTLHKVHHSRIAAETDSNYGNILSGFDRLFGTFTPAARAALVRYGLDGHDGDAQQSFDGLLRLPWSE
jgi:sterol desaturase/sphingolipid hydroxylase (fatty acid hydroxylase superfamily)